MYEYRHKNIIKSSPETIFYGDSDFDSLIRVVILNSRQTKTPSGNDPWVSQTIKAVKYASENDYTLLTGTGMNTWELACWASGLYDTAQIIISHIRSADQIPGIIENILSEFALKPARTAWLFYKSDEDARSPKANWPIRDKLALEIAHKILPVSIRPGGNLMTLIDKYQFNENVEIINDFKCDYDIKKQEQIFKPDHVQAAVPRKKWNFITHWTRTCHGPWPGETSAEFYKTLAESKNQYPNNTLETLKHILREDLIRGSGKNLRAGLSGVSFSSLHPADVLALMGWRKRLVRWNFEPYGIAISRPAAIAAGIQPVIYGRPELYEQLVKTDKPYFQSEGADGGSWRDEKEWRYLGDINLGILNPADMRIIVFRPAEIGALRGLTEASVVSFT